MPRRSATSGAQPSGNRTRGVPKTKKPPGKVQTKAEYWESLADTFVQEYIERRDLADIARDNFRAFLQLCGRSESGQVLRLDPGHLEGADFLQAAYDGGKHAWQEETRGGLKTTRLLTFAAWMIGRDPELTIKYTTNREDIAVARNEWLQGIMCTADYRRVFGARAELLKSGCAGAKTTVSGKTARKNPNIRAEGIDGVRSGPHYDVLLLDDVCDTKTSFIEPARKESVKTTFYMTLVPERNPASIGGGRKGVGLTLGQGTTYAEDDLNAELSAHAQKNAGWVYRRVLCSVNVTESGPVFETPYPTVLPIDYLAEQYDLNERAWLMNYALQAVGAEEKPFESLHFYLGEKWVANAKEWKIWGEQIGSFGYEPGILPLAEVEEPGKSRWFRCIVVDPGFSEKRQRSCTGICIGALAPTGDIYILYASKRRQKWDRTVAEIPHLYQKYACDLCVFEVAGQQDAAFWSLEKELKADCAVARIAKVSPANKSKMERAKFIASRVNAGRVLLQGVAKGRPPELRPAGPAKELHDDLLAFPAVKETDLVDAFVYLVQELRQRTRPHATPSALPQAADPDLQQGWKNFRDQAFGRDPEPGVIAESLVFN